MATFVLLGTVGSTLFCLMLLCIAVFLVLLVLVQRGRGGGLSGAFGGMGGQSAFGTKAGDTFTRITVATATIWIILCVAAAKYLGTGSRLAAAAGEDPTTPTHEVYCPTKLPSSSLYVGFCGGGGGGGGFMVRVVRVVRVFIIGVCLLGPPTHLPTLTPTHQAHRRQEQEGVRAERP